MKHLMATAAAFALLTGITAANAQNAPAAKSDTTAQTQSSQSTHASMKHSSTKHAMRTHKMRPRASLKSRSTTGSGAHIGGPRNDPSIHQSIGRDSRGTPKGPGSDQK